MDSKMLFTIIGVTLSTGAFLYYYYSILKGETKPHIYTWFLFTLTLGLAFFIQSFFKGGSGTYIILTEFIACAIATILSIKYGTKNITKLDTLFLSIALIAIAMWLFFKQAYISTILIIIIDIFAIAPTFRKSWNNPNEETIWAYLISGIAMCCSIIAIENYSFLTVAYQTEIVIGNFALVLFLLVRRKQLSLN